MILGFLAMFIIGGLLGWSLGYREGEKDGKTRIEREVLLHVLDSPDYEDRMHGAFVEAFNSVMEKRK